MGGPGEDGDMGAFGRQSAGHALVCLGTDTVIVDSLVLAL